MSKTKIAFGVVAGVVVLALVWGVALAGEENIASGPHRFARRPLGRLIQANLGRLMTLRAELNITEDQQAEIREIIKNHKSEILTVAEKFVEKKRALREAVLAEKRDEVAIRRAANELGKSIADVAVLASQIASEVRPVLSAEQIEKLKKFNTDKDNSIDNWLKEMSNSVQ